MTEFGGEAGLGLGVGVAPAHAGGDHLALPGVCVVVGATQCEVPHGGESGFEPVQSERVGGQEHQLHVIPPRPRW